MATSKRKRKYAQDFSGESMTDQSFAPACDVNNIVRHYQQTGLEPYPDRLAEYHRQAQSDETLDAMTLSYEDAMRNKAALDTYMAENPTVDLSRGPTAPPVAAPDDEVIAEPAPQDASEPKTEVE